MAFQFNWPAFDEQFVESVKRTVETALNKVQKPASIVDKIAVKELNLGTMVGSITRIRDYCLRKLYSHPSWRSWKYAICPVRGFAVSSI